MHAMLLCFRNKTPHQYEGEIPNMSLSVVSEIRATFRRKELEGVDLNELQREVEKLLGLLMNRQPGLSTWNDFMRQRLTELHRLTSLALGK